ncbi:2'-deoxycytidine 5'-triphosphate deaminase [Labrys sp. WJW]|uniref:2'-deoxycytidine 5'-triphosphate deaminase n=1 Tax=Labrys sp. WJW TaxID=1737983 RepID=UPI00082C3853|nr:2'-deoxycytidine 5'-triphosphate deaminase [Labrys sp. WJW]OCC01508.1 2'-deoxycytidine 5'-triphosphate deaminase [Labrys sp. WJW]
MPSANILHSQGILHSHGILPSQAIAGLVEAGAVRIEQPLAADQIQPASLDLRLGAKAYRMRASFLPGPRSTVAERIADLALHEIDLTKGAVLETGCVYIVPLLESLKMPDGVLASTNPKSSTGRLDVFTRVITDHARAFDQVEAGYDGPLYAEIGPRTFPVLVRTGSRLSQIRFRRGEARIDDASLRELQRRMGLVSSPDPDIAGGVAVSVDLTGFGDGIVGYRAKRHTAVIDVDKRAACDLLDFWEPIPHRGKNDMILDPDEFYILASKEAVHVPPEFAAEMVPFDPLVGEFRVHYAGFFDPGFGYSPDGMEAARAVLEVRSREVPFIVEDGQIVGRLIYERMLERPQILYGSGLNSNYQGQALKLSKHFR